MSRIIGLFDHQHNRRGLINWANPLTKGLYRVITPYSVLPPDVVRTNANWPEVGINAAGLKFTDFQANMCALKFPKPAMTEGSALYVSALPALGLTGAFSNLSNSAGSFFPYSDNSLYSADFASSRYFNALAVPGGTGTLLKPYAVATTGANNYHATAFNGKIIGSSASLAFVVTASEITVGLTGSNHACSAGMNLFAMWTRRMTHQELCELSRNPWSIFL